MAPGVNIDVLSIFGDWFQWLFWLCPSFEYRCSTVESKIIHQYSKKSHKNAFLIDEKYTSSEKLSEKYLYLFIRMRKFIIKQTFCSKTKENLKKGKKLEKSKNVKKTGKKWLIRAKNSIKLFEWLIESSCTLRCIFGMFTPGHRLFHAHIRTDTHTRALNWLKLIKIECKPSPKKNTVRFVQVMRKSIFLFAQ